MNECVNEGIWNERIKWVGDFWLFGEASILQKIFLLLSLLFVSTPTKAQVGYCMWEHFVKSEKPSEVQCGSFSYYLDVWHERRDGSQMNLRYLNPMTLKVENHMRGNAGRKKRKEVTAHLVSRNKLQMDQIFNCKFKTTEDILQGSCWEILSKNFGETRNQEGKY